MDPYLERSDLWASFRRHVVAGLYQSLLPGLVDRYRARVSLRKYTSQFVLFTTIERHDHDEEFVEIRSRSDGKLVALIDLPTPATRSTPEGRTAYLNTRQAGIAERSAYVDIDLVTQGKPMLDYDRSGLPPHDHTITVTRGGKPDRYEIYTASVRKRLPKFKLPLAADDRDTVVDLQLIVNRAYELGSFSQQIDYAAPLPPDVQFQDDDRKWVQQLLAAVAPSGK
jgi:hypothetical protein